MPPKRASTINARSAPSGLSTIVKSVYSPDKLYTEMTDTKGHYEQVNTKITPSVEAMVMQAVDDNLDYRGSKAAFIRDAIIHRLHYLHNNPGSTIDHNSVQRELHVAAMNLTHRKQRAVVEQCDLMRSTVDVCVRSKDWDSLNTHIEWMQSQLEGHVYPEGQRHMLQTVIDEALTAMSYDPEQLSV